MFTVIAMWIDVWELLKIAYSYYEKSLLPHLIYSTLRTSCWYIVACFVNNKIDSSKVENIRTVFLAWLYVCFVLFFFVCFSIYQPTARFVLCSSVRCQIIALISSFLIWVSGQIHSRSRDIIWSSVRQPMHILLWKYRWTSISSKQLWNALCDYICFTRMTFINISGNKLNIAQPSIFLESYTYYVIAFPSVSYQLTGSMQRGTWTTDVNILSILSSRIWVINVLQTFS